MKCPWGCGWEGTPEDYPEHLKSCSGYRKRNVPVLIVSPWKEKVADAIARMVVYRGRFEKRDADELAEAIQKMLDKYEKEWG